MTAVDTNILLYARDPRDRAKQTAAGSLIESLTDGALLWQVACEYVAASSKPAPFGYPAAQACNDIRDLRRAWAAVLPSGHGLGWSASIRWGTCWAGCRRRIGRGRGRRGLSDLDDRVTVGRSEGVEGPAG